MERLARLVAALVGVMLIAAVAINFANVVGRYVFDKPLFWAEEAMSLLQVAFVVIGASLVTRDRAHLRMDALEHWMGAGLKRRLDAVTSLLTLAVALLVGWMAFEIVRDMARNDQRTMGADIPLAIPYSAFLAGFVLIALFALVRLLRR